MNCNKCKYIQRITKNKKARCFVHGMVTLLNRYEKSIKQKKVIIKKEKIYYV